MFVFRLISAKIHKKHEIRPMEQDYFPFRAQKHTVRLFRKRLALISEAPRAYFGSASRLFRKRPVLISEAPRAYFGSAWASWKVDEPLIAMRRPVTEKASASGKHTFLHFFIKKIVFRLLYNK